MAYAVAIALVSYICYQVSSGRSFEALELLLAWISIIGQSGAVSLVIDSFLSMFKDIYWKLYLRKLNFFRKLTFKTLRVVKKLGHRSIKPESLRDLILHFIYGVFHLGLHCLPKYLFRCF